jgi:hypothetical protein
MTTAVKAAAPVRDEDGDFDIAEAEPFLLSHGWTKAEKEDCPTPKKRWLDPTTGKKPELKFIRQDMINKQLRQIHQLHVTADKWYYTLEDAVQIQTQRNNDGRIDD